MDRGRSAAVSQYALWEAELLPTLRERPGLREGVILAAARLQ